MRSIMTLCLFASVGCTSLTHTVVVVDADENSKFADLDSMQVEVCGKAAGGSFIPATCESSQIIASDFGFPFTIDIQPLTGDASREFRVVFTLVKDQQTIGAFSVRSGFREGERLVTRVQFADECFIPDCPTCVCGSDRSCKINVGTAECVSDLVDPTSLEVLGDDEAERLRSSASSTM